MAKAWSSVRDILRRWRVARFRRGQLTRELEDRRREEHQERLREGINDNLPPAAPLS
jgi:hypothetical protein